jgi:pimeloyl-ACP methyl ester carboxylesterase
VRANGIALHVAAIGHGPLVLFVHGFPQYWWTWRRQLTDLADAGYRAVAVDLRGYGASDKPPRGYDLPTLADDIAGLIVALGERRAVLVGNDVGGLVAWTVAARSPDVADGVIAVGAPHPLRLRAAIAADPLGQGKAFVPALLTFQIPRRPEALLTRDDVYVRSLFDAWSGPAWPSAPDYEQIIADYADSLRVGPSAHCALEFFRWAFRSLPRADGRRARRIMQRSVAAPVLQLHGAEDGCTLPTTAQGSGRFVTGDYEWHVLPGVGHYPQEEAPAEVSRHILAWLGKRDR